MQHKSSIVRLDRRALLSGVAAVAASVGFGAKADTVFDRIVIRDGWILKESDIQ